MNNKKSLNIFKKEAFEALNNYNQAKLEFNIYNNNITKNNEDYLKILNIKVLQANLKYFEAKFKQTKKKISWNHIAEVYIVPIEKCHYITPNNPIKIKKKGEFSNIIYIYTC